MPVKEPGKIMHRTATGKEFNMDQLRQKHELTPAVGNIRVNARGDELGPGGKIIKKRNEVLDEYYRSQTKEDELPMRRAEPEPEPVASKPTKPVATPEPTRPAPTKPPATPEPTKSVTAKSTTETKETDAKK